MYLQGNSATNWSSSMSGLILSRVWVSHSNDGTIFLRAEQTLLKPGDTLGLTLNHFMTFVNLVRKHYCLVIFHDTKLLNFTRTTKPFYITYRHLAIVYTYPTHRARNTQVVAYDSSSRSHHTSFLYPKSNFRIYFSSCCGLKSDIGLFLILTVAPSLFLPVPHVW